MTQLVSNIHQFVTNPDQASELETVKGKFEFYHFGELAVDDRGWGCAYRSLQTVCSWLHQQGLVAEGNSAPTHQQIEQVLLKTVDGYKGAPQWIGSWELFMYLDVTYNISSKILNSNSVQELISKFYDLHDHFRKGGSPIMSGAGSQANIILGVCKDGEREEMMLVLDPHYYGPNEPSQIIQKGYCKWRYMKELGEHVTFSNLLLPLVYINQLN
eukprot:TRINITY_DN1927_c1_g1_i1.p1 TRINITY_DN1927_c1_g1~~TRINITY_DN1927_c1_g1_i1.p1  ORF type:complete len:214 (-),score=21.26 TRINITY_DN1927_c1_g1_i1:351-992(-)